MEPIREEVIGEITSAASYESGNRNREPAYTPYNLYLTENFLLGRPVSGKRFVSTGSPLLPCLDTQKVFTERIRLKTEDFKGINLHYSYDKIKKVT